MIKVTKTKSAFLCLNMFLSLLLAANNDGKDTESENFYEPSSGRTWQAFPSNSTNAEETKNESSNRTTEIEKNKPNEIQSEGFYEPSSGKTWKAFP